MMIGPIGSGKTTHCLNHLSDYYRLSQDEMGREGVRYNFKEALEREEPLIVVDRMNFNVAQRARYIIPAIKAGYKIKYLMAHTSKGDFNLCFERAIGREDHPNIEKGDAFTVAKVLNFFYNNFEEPNDYEWDELGLL